MIKRHSKQRGFTLVEVLVSFVILSLSLIALFRAVSDGVRNKGIVDGRVAALSVAQSKMETVGILIPIKVGVVEGVEQGRYAWKIEISELLTSTNNTQKIAPYQVLVSVSDNQSRNRSPVKLSTIKLGGKR